MTKQYNLEDLQNAIEGELYTDSLHQALYATDASIYKEYPLGVVFPKSETDLITIVKYASANSLSLIPRSAGTSLAGQCVGSGLVVDVSKYLCNILQIDKTKKQVTVQPGVIRDQLNDFLKPYGLYFGPDTSTVNRCMIGGMVGNNSCGTSSIVYGSTRDHVVSLRTILSDGSVEEFTTLDESDFISKRTSSGLIGSIYSEMDKILSDKQNQIEIELQYPKKSINRRNTGYALDLLSQATPYNPLGTGLNLSQLLCGSEGTLAITSEITLQLDPLPPAHHLLVCAHYHSIADSMLATQRAMLHQPFACELMDKIILDCTKSHKEYVKNRWFVEGDPAALLIIELRNHDPLSLEDSYSKLVDDLKKQTASFAIKRIEAKDSKKVWDLRKAGLGLMSNMPGDAKPVACIEDTAVALEDLADYITEVGEMMNRYKQTPVYYAHAGAGEIHLRPVLNLKSETDRKKLYDIARDSALLVKKYQGSLSGEHGDGRVRGPFIPLVMGDKLYELFKQVKQIWDPKGLFNPGKIVETAPMNESLRYVSEQKKVNINTQFDFSSDGGLLGSLEKCNGSGDCRKLPLSGGTMCPSYHATRNEKDTTRGRANVLREFLSQNQKIQKFAHPELKEVMDLCIGCKGCSSECPSNVDMARIKSEFLYQYQSEKGFTLSNRLQAINYSLLKLANIIPGLSNFLFKAGFSSTVLKKLMGMSEKREIPLLSGTSFRSWHQSNRDRLKVQNPIKSVYLFVDEFSDLLDTHIAISCIELLSKLNYEVIITDHAESARAQFSKGFLKTAKRNAEKNVVHFAELISQEKPLIGIEPSAILSFRDEYPSIVNSSLKSSADKLAKNCLTIEEFISLEIDLGHINSTSFKSESQSILLHGHCHQKALSSMDHTVKMLSVAPNVHVEIIPSGCCGMAGSFGYEKEHFDISMQIGELVLFPAVRKAGEKAVIAAAGTSCRHQIWDGTRRKALHPVEILNDLVI